MYLFVFIVTYEYLSEMDPGLNETAFWTGQRLIKRQ